MVFLLILFCRPVFAAITDRIVAAIDNEAITLSEIEETYQYTVKLKPGVTRQSVLDTMINRALLLREARKLRIEAADEDALLQEYITLKVRGFIIVTDEDVREYYDKNKNKFGGAGFEGLRDKIREYLIEENTNSRLRNLLEDLKAKAVIRIMPDEAP